MGRISNQWKVGFGIFKGIQNEERAIERAAGAYAEVFLVRWGLQCMEMEAFQDTESFFQLQGP